jgi:hypothetical protein
MFFRFVYPEAMRRIVLIGAPVGDHPGNLCLNVDYPLGDRQGLSNIVDAVVEHRGDGKYRVSNPPEQGDDDV